MVDFPARQAVASAWFSFFKPNILHAILIHVRITRKAVAAGESGIMGGL